MNVHAYCTPKPGCFLFNLANFAQTRNNARYANFYPPALFPTLSRTQNKTLPMTGPHQIAPLRRKWHPTNATNQTPEHQFVSGRQDSSPLPSPSPLARAPTPAPSLSIELAADAHKLESGIEFGFDHRR